VAKVRYIGNEPVLCREVGEATGDGDLIAPNSVHEVPAALARRLVASSLQWVSKTSSSGGATNGA
jgi:hypothetical protein